jgi:LuxR family maltose regulon positive regulatory protein
MSPETILKTKLVIPPLRGNVVHRPRLIEKLNAVLDKKMCLVSAPAGYGKSTLLLDWIRNLDIPVAWFSIDIQDNDLSLYYSCFLQAIQGRFPKFGNSLSNLLQSSQPPTFGTIITNLINELYQLNSELIIILDDFHLIQSQNILDSMSLLLDNLPANNHIVIASRTHLPLNIGNYRVQNEIIEINLHDLRFDQNETNAFFREFMGVQLGDETAQKLIDTIEGWVAGLQLLRLSNKDTSELDRTLKKFGEGHPYISEYLMNEVIKNQPDEILLFLYTTSLLKKFNHVLCDEIMQSEISRSIIKDISDRNLFIIDLDYEQYWFRYHHLFSDFLQTRANQHFSLATQKEILNKAALWFSANGDYEEAINYFLEAQNYQNAAELIEKTGWTFLFNGRAGPLLSWLHRMPEHFMFPPFALWPLLAWAQVDRGKISNAEITLARVEGNTNKLLENSPQQHESQGLIAVIRTVIAMHDQLDFEGVRRFSQESLEYLRPTDNANRGAVYLHLGNAEMNLGDFEKAEESLNKALYLFRQGENPLAVILALSNQGELQEVRGNLKQAKHWYELSSEHVRSNGLADAYIFAKANIGLSRLSLEWMNTKGATRFLYRGLNLARGSGFLDHLLPALITAIELALFTNDIGGAKDYLWECKTMLINHENIGFGKAVIESLEARIALGTSDMGYLNDWVKTRDITSLSQHPLLSFFAIETYVRSLIELDEPERALFDLKGPLDVTLKNRYLVNHCRLGCLEINALLKIGQTRSAYTNIQRIINLTHPCGLLRSYLLLGEISIRHLLDLIREFDVASDLPRVKTQRECVQEIISAFGKQGHQESLKQIQGLIEPLTEREIEILHNVASGLTNQQISKALFVELCTVKWHLSNIYAKMGVSNRMQAIKKSRDLAIL